MALKKIDKWISGIFMVMIFTALILLIHNRYKKTDKDTTAHTPKQQESNRGKINTAK